MNNRYNSTPTDADKQRTRDFAATLADKHKFLTALKLMGITWNECKTDAGINFMRASMALSKAIACGFDPATEFAKCRSALYGAIVGDVVGSRFVGDGHAIKTKDFELFDDNCHFTAATVMTIAVADVLLSKFNSYKCIGMDILECDYHDIVSYIQRWGRKYPNAGYGHMFKDWLMSDNPKPYKSHGNGAAMRVSPCAWVHDNVRWTQALAGWSAQCTHGKRYGIPDRSCEGVKSAEAVASAIFLARTGKSKLEIKAYVEKEFGYDLSRTLDEIRPTYRYENAAAKSVPEAIIAFLESTDFEDAIRNAVSLGGAADTLAAITGSIAEAFYGVPDALKQAVREKLPLEMIRVLDNFNATLGFKVPNQV